MIYILAALLPPVGLLLNGQPISAVLNLVLIVPCVIFGLIFPVLFLVPSLHALIAVHMKREDRKHREIVDAIERLCRSGIVRSWERGPTSASSHSRDRSLSSPPVILRRSEGECRQDERKESV
jgi:hypothetical protein